VHVSWAESSGAQLGSESAGLVWWQRTSEWTESRAHFGKVEWVLVSLLIMRPVVIYALVVPLHAKQRTSWHTVSTASAVDPRGPDPVEQALVRVTRPATNQVMHAVTQQL
jgi:hypothetical protein